MKKLLLTFLILGMMCHPIYAMDEDANLFARNADTQLTPKVKYEPLEVEMVDVTDNLNPQENKPWYKSRRFWCGAAVGTAAVGTIAGISYAIYSALKMMKPRVLIL